MLLEALRKIFKCIVAFGILFHENVLDAFVDRCNIKSVLPFLVVDSFFAQNLLPDIESIPQLGHLRWKQVHATHVHAQQAP
jgi:hypothetical protein